MKTIQSTVTPRRLRSFRGRALLPLLAAALLWLAPASAGAIEFQMIDLGTLGGNGSTALAVNGLGQVVGWSYVVDKHGDPAGSHAFLWNGGNLIDLGTLGGKISGARAINDAGWVMGYSETGDVYYDDGSPIPLPVQHPFVWTATTGMVDINPPGSTFAEAVAMNSSGQVALYAIPAGGEYRHAFLWTPGEGTTDLGDLGSGVSFAVGINDSGEVAGYSFTAGGEEHVFLWTPGRGMIDLGAGSSVHGPNNLGQVLAHDHTTDSTGHTHLFPFIATLDGRRDLPQDFGGSAINNVGQVAGTGLGGAVLWTDDGTANGSLQNLGGDVGIALNDAGEVVGYSQLATGRHAFFWSESSGNVDLGTLSASSPSSLAYAVNSSSVVAGFSNTDDGGHAVVWLPAGLDSPLQHQMDGLISLLADLVLSGAIDDPVAAPLTAKFSAANNALARGHQKPAIRLLESTMIQVAALAAAGRLDPDAAEALLGELSDVLALLDP